MTAFLLLGLSSIGQRRVLPALERMDAVHRIDVASRSKEVDIELRKRGATFQVYAQALAESDAEFVYISLPNSLHESWIRAALDQGKHVVVDKPATLTAASAEALSEVARSRGLLLAEATVFDYHSQVAAMHAFIAETGGLTHVDAQFIIPPLPAENFRNQADLGGGCLLDMGSYAAAVARQFGGTLAHLDAVGPKPSADQIDMGFSVLARFENGVRLTGHFSFESEYQNRLLLVTRRGSLMTERPFSLPGDMGPVWQARRANKSETIELPADDAFENFLSAVISEARNPASGALMSNLRAGALFRDQIARSLARQDRA